MDLSLNNKIALVTGASQGIGYAIAAGLVKEGAQVIISSRDAAKLSAAKEAIGAAAAFPADVSQPNAIEILMAQVTDSFGAPDIAVINAGGPPPGVPSSLDEDAWAKGYDLTLMSAVRLASACIPAMREKRWGRILFVTSLSVKEPIPTLTLSNAFRAAVTGYARTLATEVAAEGVTVNCVAPGMTDTQRLRQLHPNPETLEAATQQIPAKRLATPDEVAAAAVFLAGQPAAMITGQTILVDGGLVGTLL